jgi:hypothetical protein
MGSLAQGGQGAVRRLAGALIALAALLPFASGAHAAQPMPYSALSPDDGFAHTVSSWPRATDAEMFDFFVDTSSPPATIPFLILEVSTQNTPGQDGTLADDFRVDYELLNRSDAYPTQFRARTSPAAPWLAQPGTYYWQVSYSNYDYTTGCSPCIYVTPVRSIQITPRPQPPQPVPTVPTQQSSPDLMMRTSDAHYYVRTMIRRKTGRTPRGLRYKCARLTTRSFRCRPSWHDSRYVFAGTAVFRHFLGSDRQVYASVSFSGLRASRSCVRRQGGVKSCAHRVRWQV